MDGYGWDGMGWDLCAGLLYEHRFAMLINSGGSLECMELLLEIMRIRRKWTGKDRDQSTWFWWNILPNS